MTTDSNCKLYNRMIWVSMSSSLVTHRHTHTHTHTHTDTHTDTHTHTHTHTEREIYIFRCLVTLHDCHVEGYTIQLQLPICQKFIAISDTLALTSYIPNLLVAKAFQN